MTIGPRGWISIYADGSSSARSALPGGWAFVVVQDQRPIHAGAGSDPSTTNQRMEMTAAIRGLAAAVALGLQSVDMPLELVSDSEYTLGLGSGRFQPSKNLDLAKELRDLCIQTGCRFRWVRGHTGDQWNERCDSLAKRAKEALKKTLVS